MNGFSNMFSTIALLESILRLLTYIAVISALFKVVQALNVYINKNSR